MAATGCHRLKLRQLALQLLHRQADDVGFAPGEDVDPVEAVLIAEKLPNITPEGAESSLSPTAY